MTEQASNLPVLTMTSLAIAELTGKRHDNVLRDIRAMLDDSEEEIDLLSFEDSYLGADGTGRPMYRLPKEWTMTLVTGYSVPLRLRMVRRWEYLEAERAKAQPAPWPININDPKVLRAMLMAYADNVEKLETDKEALEVEKQGLMAEKKDLEHDVDIMVPQVAALHRIALEPANQAPVSLRAAAKNVGVPPKWLVDWMIEHKWLYRGAGEPPGDLIPYQPKITAGYLEMKIVEQVRTSKTNSTVQVTRRFLQPVVTQKGRARLGVELEKCVGVPNTSIRTPKPRKPATKSKPPGRGMNPDAPNGLARADGP